MTETVARSPAYRLIDHDVLIVARVECRDADRAKREIDHYAAVYVQDGPVAVQERRGKRWHTLYVMALR